MSVRVMSQVWELDLPAFEKLVLLALADCANDEGLAWPSIATLRRKTNAGERTVQRSLRSLEAAGLLRRDEVPGKGCKYHLDPRHSGTPAKQAPAPEKAQTPATAAPKPSRTIINGLADAKPTRAKGWPEIPDWMPVLQWNAYLKMRKSIHKWPTDDAVVLMLGKLDRWRAQGHDPGAILDNSTENNWTGLFEPRKPANDRPTASNDTITNPMVRAVARSQAARAGPGGG